MGLPMFIEPETTESKATIKADPSAPARSAIRRQRTVRYSPHISMDRPSWSPTHSITTAREPDRRPLIHRISRRDPTLARAHGDETIDMETEANLAHVEASQRRRQESGRALLRDALSYERQGQRTRSHHYHHHHPHRRHHRLATQVSASSRHLSFTAQGIPYYSDSRSGSTIANIDGSSPQPVATEVRSPPPEYMPTPPYTSGDASNRSTPPSGTASLTPRFAPARRYTETAEAAFRQYTARYNLDGPMEQEPDSLRAMRHMTHQNRSHHSSGRTYSELDAVNGLGDRRRSFSHEDDSWETLLTTIAPDERLPSAHSSFTSATASGSSLSSDSPLSYGTLVTAASSVDNPDTYPTICDNTESEDSDTDDANYEELERQLLDSSGDDTNHLASHRHRARMRALEIDHVEQLARQGQALEREEELNQMEARLDRAEQLVHRRMPIDADEVRQMEAQLDRRQREIPDEAWALAARNRATGTRAGRERL